MPPRLTDEQTVTVMRDAGFEPLEPYPGAAVPWRCRCLTCERESSPSYANTRKGRGCVWCAGLRIGPGEAVAAMRDKDFEPLEPYPGNNRPWRCRCTKCGHEVAPTYTTVRKGHGCAYCAGQRVDPADALLLMVRAGLDPLVPYPSNDRPWRSVCSVCGYEVSPKYADVRRGQGGCGWCAKNRVDPDEAVVVMVSAGLEALTTYPGGHKPWRSRCLMCNREVSPTYSHVKDRERGCAYCAKKRVDPDEAKGSMGAADFEPLEPYPGVDVPWRCLCNVCGNEVAPTYTSVRNDHGCAWCAGMRVDPDEAVRLANAVGLEPLERYPGYSRGWLCRCLECDKRVSPHFSTIRNGGGCAWCAGNRIDPQEAVEVMKAAGLVPLEDYQTAASPWRCRCTTCGRESTPRFANVQNGRGCRFCADSGFNYTAPGVVYLMSNSDFYAAKVGITTTAVKHSRVAQHERYGWRLVRTWDVLTGEDAAYIEQTILDWWRDVLGAPEGLGSDDTPQGGWTETASLVHVDLDETIERIDAEVGRLAE